MSAPLNNSELSPILPPSTFAPTPEFSILHEGKNYRFKVSIKSGTVLTEEQKTKLFHKLYPVFKKELANKEKINIKVTPKTAKVKINDIISQDKAVKVFNEVKSAQPALFKSGAASFKASLEQIPRPPVEHLYYDESYKYVESFFNSLINRVNDEQKREELTVLKETSLDNLKKEYLNVVRSLDEREAQKEWGSEKEKERQEKTAEALSKALYEGLAIAVLGGAGDDPAKLHKAVCDEIANNRMKGITKENKIDVSHEFTVATGRRGNPLSAEVRTLQYGDKITGSMEERKAKKNDDEIKVGEFKFYGVNLHTETVTFTPKFGAPITSTQLRSGSFDFKDSYESKDFNEVLAKAYEKKRLAEAYQKKRPVISLEEVQKMTEKELKKEIREVRLDDNPAGLDHLIKVLEKHVEQYRTTHPKKDPPNFPKADIKLEKYKTELENKVRDFRIIQNNGLCLESVFDLAENPEMEHIGMRFSDAELENDIQEILVDAGLKMPHPSGVNKGRYKQNWGMISLQTPANIRSDRRWNPLIRTVGPWFGKHNVNDPDQSELDPVYRELVAYQAVTGPDSDLVNEGLYFNIPTNDIGAYKDYFNHGLVDKERSAKIDKATQDSTVMLRSYADKVLKIIGEKQNRSEGLERYYHALQSLVEQTFHVEKQNGEIKSVKLKTPPGKNAKFEILGRITVIMQMLDFKTTGHCRSGNNRTAAWLAKTHQIVGTMAASEDGDVPPPDVMAGKLGSRKSYFFDKRRDHWSLKIFLNTLKNSLTLQQANKGTRGTKQKIHEISNPTYRTAVTRGAFDLAGKFNEKLLKQARLKLVKARVKDLLDDQSLIADDKLRNEIYNLIRLVARDGNKNEMLQELNKIEKSFPENEPFWHQGKEYTIKPMWLYRISSLRNEIKSLP